MKANPKPLPKVSPCLWCGSRDYGFVGGETPGGTECTWVCCDNCGAGGPWAISNTKREAIQLWNLGPTSLTVDRMFRLIKWIRKVAADRAKQASQLTECTEFLGSATA